MLYGGYEFRLFRAGIYLVWKLGFAGDVLIEKHDAPHAVSTANDNYCERQSTSKMWDSVRSCFHPLLGPAHGSRDRAL